jgi:tripartite-type tricarboxylate transporter receptor subunit TctC
LSADQEQSMTCIATDTTRKGNLGLPATHAVGWRRRTTIALFAAAAANAVGVSYAQEFPTRPVEIIVPYAAGGGNDILARVIGRELSEAWQVGVVIDNRGGAGGNIGAQLAARAAPDGYTLVMINNAFTINPYIYKNVPFDLQKDFTPIALVADSPFIIVVNKDTPVGSIQDLIQYAKNKPGELNYGTPGVGTPQHVAAELFERLTQTDMTHVPYRGTGPSVIGLLGNEVQVMFATPASVEPYIRSGEFKALGVTSGARAKMFPELPTVAEAGVAGYDIGIWWGMAGPAGIPKELVGALHEAIATAVESEKVRASLASQGVIPRASSPEEFAELIRSDLLRWKDIVAAANIAPQ